LGALNQTSRRAFAQRLISNVSHTRPTMEPRKRLRLRSGTNTKQKEIRHNHQNTSTNNLAKMGTEANHLIHTQPSRCNQLADMTSIADLLLFWIRPRTVPQHTIVRAGGLHHKAPVDAYVQSIPLYFCPSQPQKPNVLLSISPCPLLLMSQHLLGGPAVFAGKAGFSHAGFF